MKDTPAAGLREQARQLTSEINNSTAHPVYVETQIMKAMLAALKEAEEAVYVKPKSFSGLGIDLISRDDARNTIAEIADKLRRAQAEKGE